MFNLIKTEWLKIKNYRAFWLVIGINILTYPGINYMFYNAWLEMTRKKDATGEIAKALMGNPFEFPEVFHTSAFFSSIFVFIPGILVIMLITNEYNFKTHRQNIIDGWSRKQFLGGKFFAVLLITVLITILFFAVALAIGFRSTEGEIKNIWGESKYIGLFSLQTFSQLSLAFLVGFLVRRSFIALSIFVFYFLILENVLGGLLKVKGVDAFFLPLEISDRMIPIAGFLGRLDEKGYKKALESIGEHTIYTIIFTALVWGICYYFNEKRDL